MNEFMFNTSPVHLVTRYLNHLGNHYGNIRKALLSAYCPRKKIEELRKNNNFLLNAGSGTSGCFNYGDIFIVNSCYSVLREKKIFFACNKIIIFWIFPKIYWSSNYCDLFLLRYGCFVFIYKRNKNCFKKFLIIFKTDHWS